MECHSPSFSRPPGNVAGLQKALLGLSTGIDNRYNPCGFTARSWLLRECLDDERSEQPGESGRQLFPPPDEPLILGVRPSQLVHVAAEHMVAPLDQRRHRPALFLEVVELRDGVLTTQGMPDPSSG